MRAVGLVFWTQLRHRWRSWLAISILISLVGGVVMAAAAAGRRTESAIPTFVADHGFDAEVYSTQSSPKIPRLPEVSAATVAFGPDNGQPTCACTHPLNPSYFGVLVLPTKGRPAFNLVSGRLPDPSNPDEVARLVHPPTRRGRTPGNRHPCALLRPVAIVGVQQRNGGSAQTHGPDGGLAGGRVRSHRVRFPLWQHSPVQPLRLSRPSPAPCSPMWRRATCTSSASVGAQPTFPDSTLPPAPWGTAYTQNEDAQVASVEASIHPQAIGWWLLAALAALVGLVVIGQALGRQSIAESADFPTMVALGVERRQLVMLGTARNLVVGVVGAFGAVRDRHRPLSDRPAW